jgi:hypothetical protein
MLCHALIAHAEHEDLGKPDEMSASRFKQRFRARGVASVSV